MKNIFFLILVLFIGNVAYSQQGSWNKITGKNEFTDSLKFDKPRNNPNEDSVLTLDYNTRKVKMVLRGSGGVNPNDSTSRKIFGEVIWDSLLVFHSTPMSYYILGRHFNAPAKSYTLDPPYVTRNRTDIWVVDTLNNIFVIKGDSSGLKPQYNPLSQFEVASVDILANTNVPSDITNTGVYLENVEWIGTTVIPGGIFNYTINPYAGIYSTYMPNFTNLQYFQYTDVTTHLLSDYSVLRFYVLSNTTYQGNINISIYNDDTVKTNLLTILNGQYGFNSSDTGAYQLVAIPISAFVPISTINFNTIRFTFSGTSTTPVQFDNVILQSGGGSTGNIGVYSFQGEDGSTPRTGNVVFRYTDDIHAVNDVTLNGDTSFYDLKNSLGNTLNSVWIAKNPIIAGTNMTIVPSNVTVFGNPVTAYTFNANGGSISSNPQWSVRDSVSIPPVTPLDSSKYLVGTGASGVFTGHENEIATYDSATVSYSFQAAAIGDLLYDAANSMVSQGTGTSGVVTAWVWVGRLLIHQGGDFVNYGPIKIGSIQYQPLEFITNSVRSGLVGDSTTQNTTDGFGAGRYLPSQKNSSNGVQEGNTALGYKALQFNTSGSYNTATGMGALGSTTIGGQNTANGKDALFSNVDGVNNTGVGYFALRGNVSAVDNTAIGWSAMSGSLTGQGNTAIGKNALLVNTSGQLQVAVGVDALSSNTTGSLNTGVGRQSLLNNTTGSNNAGLGINTLRMNTTGENNTGNGSSAGFYNTIGSNNTFIGYQAGAYVGDLTQANIVNNSILIGYKSRVSIDNQTNQIVIGTDVTGLGSNTALYGDSAITLSQIMGQIKTPEYGHGSHIGTPAYATGWLADGTMIEYTPGGGSGGGLNIYNGDSVLAGDRLVGLNGHTLEFSQAGNTGLSIDPTVDAEFISFKASNITGGGNVGVFRGTTSSTQGQVQILSQFDGGTKQTEILGVSNTSSSTITYTADSHTMSGKDVRLSTTDGTATSSFEVEGIGSDFVGFNANSTDGTNPAISILGDAVANTITHTATSHVFNGVITYNTPPNGLATDSVLTRDASTGVVNMRAASSFGSNETLQQVFDIENGSAQMNKGDTIITNGNTFIIGEITGDINGFQYTQAGSSMQTYYSANTNKAEVQTSADVDGATFQLYANDHLGQNANIFGSANDVENSLTYSALNHLYNGILNFNSYTGGTYDATPDRALGIDAAGKMITFVSSGGGRADSTYFWQKGGNNGISGSATIGTLNNTSFPFITAGTKRMIIDSVGNVGIGTNTPIKMFHVVGTAGPFARFERSTSSTGGNFVDLYNPESTDGNTSFLTFTTLTTNTGAADQLMARIGAVYNIHDNATRAASLSFFTANGGATSERMRITPSGGLLLGTTTELASSLATFTSTTKGILIPRLTTTQQTAVSSPATGLAVINTDSSSAPTIYDGTRWKKLLFSLDAASTYAPISGGAYVSSTGTTGDINSYSATNTPSRIAAVATGQLFASAGTGTLPVWSASPTLSTSLTTPLVIGGTGTTSALTIQSTSGVGTTNADIIFKVGNNGGTEASRVTNNGVTSITGGSATSQTGINGLHLSFNSNTGYISSVQQGTSYRALIIDAASQTFNTSGVITAYMTSGKIAVGHSSPTAKLHIAAGTASPSTAPLKFTSGPLLTTPEAGAVEFLTDGYYATTTTGAKRRFLAAATSGRSTAQTAANASVSTYTLGASDASYEVSANVLVTTSSAETFMVTCAYTDEGNTARTVTLPFAVLAGTTVAAINFSNGAVPYQGIPIHLRVKASTTITIATTGTFTGATYNVEGIIKQTQ